MKKLFAIVCLAVTVMAPIAMLNGCATKLAPEGVYKGDAVAYQADNAIVTAYDTLHAFVKWEYDNRAALAKTPEIKNAADVVRNNAQRWILSAQALNDAYQANPTSENKTALEKALATLRTAIAQAVTYLPKK